MSQKQILKSFTGEQLNWPLNKHGYFYTSGNGKYRMLPKKTIVTFQPINDYGECINMEKKPGKEIIGFGRICDQIRFQKDILYCVEYNRIYYRTMGSLIKYPDTLSENITPLVNATVYHPNENLPIAYALRI
jgi:hypothetical protein